MGKILYKIIEMLTRYLNRSLSSHIATQLRKCGKEFVIEFPCDLLNPRSISIGNNFVGRANCKIRAYKEFAGKFYNPEIVIGNNVYFGTDCYIGAIGNIRFEDNVTIASRVTIIDHAHGLQNYSDINEPVMSRALSSKGPIIVENNVWIGENAVILSGITIGCNSIIGANSVVTRSIPPYSIACGVPARVIKNIL